MSVVDHDRLMAHGNCFCKETEAYLKRKYYFLFHRPHFWCMESFYLVNEKSVNFSFVFVFFVVGKYTLFYCAVLRSLDNVCL